MERMDIGRVIRVWENVPEPLPLSYWELLQLIRQQEEDLPDTPTWWNYYPR